MKQVLNSFSFSRYRCKELPVPSDRSSRTRASISRGCRSHNGSGVPPSLASLAAASRLSVDNIPIQRDGDRSSPSPSPWALLSDILGHMNAAHIKSITVMEGCLRLAHERIPPRLRGSWKAEGIILSQDVFVQGFTQTMPNIPRSKVEALYALLAKEGGVALHSIYGMLSLCLLKRGASVPEIAHAVFDGIAWELTHLISEERPTNAPDLFNDPSLRMPSQAVAGVLSDICSLVSSSSYNDLPFVRDKLNEFMELKTLAHHRQISTSTQFCSTDRGTVSMSELIDFFESRRSYRTLLLGTHLDVSLQLCPKAASVEFKYDLKVAEIMASDSKNSLPIQSN